MEKIMQLLATPEFLVTGGFILIAPVIFYFLNKKVKSVEDKILRRVTKSQEENEADISNETVEKKPRQLTPEEIKQKTKEIMERE